MKNIKTLLLILFVAFSYLQSFAGDDDKKKDCPHEFKMIYTLKTTPVKSQDNTGTCWSYATTSFIESELLRMGKKELDLSEMYFVRNCYPPKAEKYVRYHGSSNFGPGGQAHNVMWVVKNFGMVPDEFYTGKTYGQEKHDHTELSKIFEGMLGAIVKTRGEVTPVWQKGFTSLLDIYLGQVPENFAVEGVEYTPISFTESLGFNPDDYIEFTSFTNYPLYEKVNLEIPDNWQNAAYYNVSIDEIMQIIENSLANGYTVSWDGDVGGDNFLKAGYAVVPDEKDEKDESDEPRPEKEKNVTQEMRQKAFDSYSVTDDHLMHITGLAENQNGTKFYYTKNSWGTKDKGFEGYWYMSEPYVRLKTIAILVNKNAVPKEIMQKFE